MAKRFLLLQVITPHYHQELALKNMAELEQLVSTYGGEIVAKSIQHRVKPHPDMYIGRGKVEWVKETIKDQKIDVVVINAIVKAGQLFRLEKTLWEVNTRIAVWDRVDLILNIFDQHATTTESKLQIELARIQHKGPRIYGLGRTELSRQGGGIGTKGIGETNIEIERRNIKKLTQKIKKELQQRARDQHKRIRNRQQMGIKTVALVGYTSAGKTTLFNALTNKRKAENPALFTTLDSVVGKLKIAPHAPTVLISDTIGFIEDLPPLLVEAFRSTLLESLEAQLLFHVIDAADPELEEKIRVVEEILGDLGIVEPPVLIFNKSDLLNDTQHAVVSAKYSDRAHYFVSAKTGLGLDTLKQVMSEVMDVPLVPK